jgi:hypothetical protein
MIRRQAIDYRSGTLADIFRSLFHTHWPAIKGLLVFLVVIHVAFLFLTVIVNQIGDANPVFIAQKTIAVMHWDKVIFGQYLPFWMQNLSANSLMSVLVYIAYLDLGIILTGVVILLLFTQSVGKIRFFLLSFFMVVYLGVPFWYMFPALTPYEMYASNVLQATFPADQAVYTEQQLAKTSPLVKNLQKSIAPFGSMPTQGRYHVPTFPSMHIAWGTLMVYFSYVIWVPFGILMTLWFIANAAGALFTMQHYGVDLLLGMAIAAIAILLVRWLLSLEGTILSKPTFVYQFMGIPRDDLRLLDKKTMEFFRKKFSRWFY